MTAVSVKFMVQPEEEEEEESPPPPPPPSRFVATSCSTALSCWALGRTPRLVLEAHLDKDNDNDNDKDEENDNDKDKDNDNDNDKDKDAKHNSKTYTQTLKAHLDTSLKVQGPCTSL